MILKYMDTIFNALNPENKDDIFDCCNGNLKCKENEFAKKCVSGTSGSTFSFKAPELTCDISINNRRFIYEAGVAFTSFLNQQTNVLIQAIKNNEFGPLEMTIPSGSYISIFDTSTTQRIFTNSPLEFEITYADAANLYTIAASSASSGQAVLFLRYINKNLLTTPQFKTMIKNMSRGIITPHASAINYTTAASYGSTLTAETVIINPCGPQSVQANKYLIYEVQKV